MLRDVKVSVGLVRQKLPVAKPGSKRGNCRSVTEWAGTKTGGTTHAPGVRTAGSCGSTSAVENSANWPPNSAPSTARSAKSSEWPRAEREKITELDETLDELNELADLLVRAALLAAGYHQHKRGIWRKRRV